MAFAQPSIEIYGIRIDEPVTTITDLMVTAVCWYAFARLSRIPVKNNVHLYLKYYFLSMGMATAIGGLIGHGFIYLFSFPWKLPGWLISMLSVALLERAVILYARKLIHPFLGKLFAWLNVIELATFVTITFITLNFFFVELHAAYGLLVVTTGFSLIVYVKTRNKGSRTFLVAVAFSSVSALIFMNEWGIGPWFNHYDISHLLMATSAWFFYKGSLLVIADPLAMNEQA